MHCKQCGQSIDEDSRFCRYCGASQVASPPTQTLKGAADKEKIEAANRAHTRTIWIVSAGVLLVLAVSTISGNTDTSVNDSVEAGTTPSSPERPSILVSTIAEAEAASRNLINEGGHSCDAVTSLSPIGSIESGGTVHRANCSNGEQYAVVLSEDDHVRFLSSCAVFTASTGERC